MPSLTIAEEAISTCSDLEQLAQSRAELCPLVQLQTRGCDPLLLVSGGGMVYNNKARGVIRHIEAMGGSVIRDIATLLLLSSFDRVCDPR